MAQAIEKKNLHLKNDDVVAVASKVVSLCEHRIVQLDDVRVSPAARRVAKRWHIDERLARIAMDEADWILGGLNGFLLTVKNGILTANAGVDLKNSPPGTASLWPENPDKSARTLRRFLERRQRISLGVEVVDSRVAPLRLGTIGLAIGVSGFAPVADERGKPDLYGRKVRVTQINVADDLAASAHLLMRETTERIGAVILRNAPVKFSGEFGSRRATLSMRRCLILSNITRKFGADGS